MNLDSEIIIRSGNPINLLSVAQSYIDAGLLIFPTMLRWSDEKGKYLKQPLVRGGHHNASNEKKQVEAWWSKHPTATIGLPCGPNNLTILDFDTYKNASCIQEFEAKLGITLKDSPVQVRTPSGGLHIYFRIPDAAEFHSPTGFLTECVDVRSSGAYVLAPDGFNYVLRESEHGVDPNALLKAPILPETIADQLQRKTDQTKPCMPQEPAQINDFTRSKIRTLLRSIDPNPYDKWITVGMVLSEVYNRDSEGLSVWLRWASQSEKFNEEEHLVKWKSFKGRGSKVGLGTLSRLASDGLFSKTGGDNE